MFQPLSGPQCQPGTPIVNTFLFTTELNENPELVVCPRSSGLFLQTSSVPYQASSLKNMYRRSEAQTIADLQHLLDTLKQNRRAYDPVPLGQLRRILRCRIASLKKELRGTAISGRNRHAA